jgi:hypothetical protein
MRCVTSVAEADAQARSRRDPVERRAAPDRQRDEALSASSLVSLAARDPALLTGDGLDTLQRTAGNQAVVELLDGRAAVQRRKEPGEGSSEGGVYSDGPAEPAALTATQRLSGAHWKKIADDNWGGATPNIAELESSFGSDLTKFLDMLAANNITYSLTSGYRPPQRSYLFHYCVKVAKGKIAPKDVPAMVGVDIVWDHGNAAASKAGAQALADAFGLVGVAAHPSNHNAGTAVDMKLDFSANAGNKLTYVIGGKTITRTIKTSDEARVGVSAKGKSISGIGSRELSKAGADFGVKRAVDSDIVHWSRTGN